MLTAMIWLYTLGAAWTAATIRAWHMGAELPYSWPRVAFCAAVWPLTIYTGWRNRC